MKRLLSIAGAFVALAAAAPAHAFLIDARFAGIVDTQRNYPTLPSGASVDGEFVYDTATSRYVSFTIGGLSVAPGYASTASVTPDLYSAIYQAQLSPVPGGTLNSTFNLDLEGIGRWPSSNAIALLLNASQLANNLDTTLSTFGFFTGNADGTNIRSLSAALSRIQVTAIPEPGSVLLLVAGAAAAAMRLRRRRT